MRRGIVLKLIYLAILASVSGPSAVAARADDAVHWAPDLEAAKRAAAQSNRLVLVHFWAPWCGPCMRLESTVFNQPLVARDIEARFVPVKLNADDWPATARNFGIERLPTDVIITPTGRALYKLGCPSDPNQYMAQLGQAASSAQGVVAGGTPGQRPFSTVQAPTVPLGATPASSVGPPNNVAVVRPTIVPAVPSAIASDVSSGNGSAPPPARNAMSDVAPPRFAQNNDAPYAPRNPVVETASNRQMPSNAASPAGVPTSTVTAGGGNIAVRPNGSQMVSAQPGPSANAQSLGLDGFCPVTLIERSRTAPDDPGCWIRGDPRWGAVHRGVTYLFNGPEEQKRFLASPDRYAPALGGNDAVLAFDRAKLVRGRREFGTFCESRIYLFASKETLDEFQKDPRRYVEEVRQAENPPHAAVR